MLPFRPRPEHQDNLNLVLGEAADLQTRLSTLQPLYLPSNGLYTNTIAFGSVGSGKTAGLLYPLLRQLIAHEAHDPEKRVGGMVLDAKDDFSKQTRIYLEKYGRGEDFYYLRADGDLVFNPVHDADMPGQVVASLMVSLIKQVVGESKEAFWTGQYAVLVDNAVQAMRAAFDYTNLLLIEPMVIPEVGDEVCSYLEQIAKHPECILVYRNIITNTELPWILEDDGETRRSVTLRGDAATHRPCDDPLTLFKSRLADEEVDLDQLAVQIRAHLAVDHPTDLPDAPTPDPQWRDWYDAWRGLLDHPAPVDKAAIFEFSVLLLDLTFERLCLNNPFPNNNPFEHEIYGGAVSQVHFFVAPDTGLTRWLVRRLHHLVVDQDRLSIIQAFVNWYRFSWESGKDVELRAKIASGPEVITNYFKEPEIRRRFQVSMATFFDLQYNPTRNQFSLLPDFDTFLSRGYWLCVGIPKARYHRITDIIVTLLKQQFQCVALQRTSQTKRALRPDLNYDRSFALLIDEYHIFATAGDGLDADNNFFSLNRQCRVFAILATQTIENIKGRFAKEAYVEQLLGCVRNKIFLGVENAETAQYASKLLSKGLIYRISANVAENQKETPFSLVAGAYQGLEASLSQGRQFNQTMEERMQPREFLELPTFEAILIGYDGNQRVLSRFFCKPYWREPSEAFHWQVAEGVLQSTQRRPNL